MRTPGSTKLGSTVAGENWSLVTLNSKGITPRDEVTLLPIDSGYVPRLRVHARAPDPHHQRLG